MKVDGQANVSATLPQGGNDPGIHWSIGQFGPTAGLDILEKRKMACFCLDPNSEWHSPYPSQYIDWDHV
jgi:hypothetical protein